METIYIKRFIKTEADLPQSERAKYFVGVKDNLNPEDIYEWFNYKNPVMADNQAEYWINTFDYWLQPTTLAELIKMKCPNCLGTGRDGHDRCDPPNWYGGR